MNSERKPAVGQIWREEGKNPQGGAHVVEKKVQILILRLKRKEKGGGRKIYLLHSKNGSKMEKGRTGVRGMTKVGIYVWGLKRQDQI